MMRVRAFAGGPFAENGYVASCETTGATVVIDPGASAPDMVRYLAAESLRPQAVLLTHAHLDHVEGLPVVLDYAEAPVWLHPLDRPMFDALDQQAAMFGLAAPALSPPDEAFEDGQLYTFGECSLRVVLTPGHAPGHVILYSEADELVFSGDLVFLGSVGRTDLPGGNYRELFQSIRESILTLPDETRLLSGHGPETTVGHERVSNPFLVPQYGGELA